jgi:hypothetical protein
MRLADTTAIFEYHVGASGPRDEVRTLLALRRDVATSEHAVREWRRILTSAVGDLLTALEEEPDLPAVLGRVSQGFGREPSQRLRALGLCCGPLEFNIVEARVRARQVLRVEIGRLVDQIVSEVRAPSACPLATNKPYMQADRWKIDSTCKRGAGICRRVEYLEQESSRWQAGADALAESESPDYRRLGRVGREMARDATRRTGKNCYQLTGDLAIALDGAAGDEVVTTDRSFTVLGPPMGLQVHLVKTVRPPEQS